MRESAIATLPVVLAATESLAEVLHKTAHALRGVLSTFSMVANRVAADLEDGPELAALLRSKVKQLDEMSDRLSELARQIECETTEKSFIP